MRWIVGGLVVVLTVLNAPSTALAANRCVSLGWWPGGAHGLVALGPGERLSIRQPNCLVDQLVLVAGKTPIAVTVSGPGWHGTLHSPASRLDGLVDGHALIGGNLESGGHANLELLRRRLATPKKKDERVRLLPALLLIALFAWVATRRRRSPRSPRS